MSKLHNLDPKRRRFVEEYAVDWNASQAAIRAGYSAQTAKQQGSRLLTFVDVQEALAEVMQQRSERCKVSVDQVIDELAKLAFLNMADYMRIGADGDPFVDLSAATRAQKAGLLDFECHDYKDGRGEDARDVRKVRIKLNPGKLTALVKLGEHLGLFKGDAGKGGEDGIDYAEVVRREQMRIEKMEEIAARWLPKPKKKQAE